jgi:hypothetical protein
MYRKRGGESIAAAFFLPARTNGSFFVRGRWQKAKFLYNAPLSKGA